MRHKKHKYLERDDKNNKKTGLDKAKELEKEFLKEVLDGDDLYRENHIHKYWIWFMALFILIITLPFFLFSMPYFGRFLGLISADSGFNNTFHYGTTSIVFDKEVLNFLKSNYDLQNKHESAYCLIGSIVNKVYNINVIYQPKVNSKGYAFVNFRQCPTDTLIMLHTHPLRDCVPSQTDIDTINKVRSINNKTIASIMCDYNKFVFY